MKPRKPGCRVSALGFALAFASALLLSGCSAGEPQSATGSEARLSVMAGIAPVAYLARAIGGERLALETVLPSGANPHTYEVRPSQAGALAHARLFFIAGLPFELSIADRLGAAQNLRVVDTTAGIHRVPEQGSEAEASDHDAEDDPHVWLTPLNLRSMAADIARALIATDPAGAADYREGLAELSRRLTALDERLRATLTPLHGKRFYVYHAAYGYLAEAYGLQQVAVEVGGKEPSPRHIAALIEQARADGVRLIIVQPQFSSRSAEVIARAIGGVVVSVDPESDDPVRELENLADLLNRYLSPETEKQNV